MTSSYIAFPPHRKSAAGWLVFLFCVTPLFLTACTSSAQVPGKGIDDTWQGTLELPQKNLRIVLKVTRGTDGALAGTACSRQRGHQICGMAGAIRGPGSEEGFDVHK
jgi:hypothetical protein